MALEMIALAWAAGLVAVLVLQRHADRRAWPVWDELRRDADGIVQGLRDSLERRRHTIGLAVAAAEAAHAHGDRSQAVRLWHSSVEALELLVDDLGEWLQAWSEAARALLALAPVQPPRVNELRMPRLRALAVAWKLAHLVAVTSRERFLLRTFMLAHALRALLRFWRRVRLPRRTRPTWTQARVFECDLATLSEASIETYRALLSSQQAADFRAKTA